MKTEVGLWIDHRKAVIISIENKTVMTQEITSNMEKHVRFSSSRDSSTADGPQGSTREDTRDRQYDNHLDKYYDGILSIICEADSIWIFGPGEAKNELENRLRHAGLGARVVGIEAADKMTDRQLSAKVQSRFHRKLRFGSVV